MESGFGPQYHHLDHHPAILPSGMPLATNFVTAILKPTDGSALKQIQLKNMWIVSAQSQGMKSLWCELIAFWVLMSHTFLDLSIFGLIWVWRGFKSSVCFLIEKNRLRPQNEVIMPLRSYDDCGEQNVLICEKKFCSKIHYEFNLCLESIRNPRDSIICSCKKIERLDWFEYTFLGYSTRILTRTLKLEAP